MDRTTELNNVLTYITDTLLLEAPSSEITIEYLVASILDNKKCHAHFIIEDCLMSSNVEELRKIYDDFLKSKSQSYTPLDNSKNPSFNDEVMSVLIFAEEESIRSNSLKVGTEHVLLALLNKDSKVGEKTFSILTNVGLSYALILSKCVEAQKQAEELLKNKKQRKRNEQKLLKEISDIALNQNDIPPASKLTSNSSNSNSSILSKHTLNLTKLAKEGKLDALIGREKEIRQIIKTLARKKKNNVILVGESGCGKTQIGYGLANLIANGQVPSILEGKEMLMLNVMSLVSGTHLRGMFEERVRNLFDELKKSKKYILFIDNMQYALKSGSKDNDADLSSILTDVLNEGEVRVVGAVTPKAYHSAVESNQAVASKMQKIVVEPLTRRETIDVINEIKGKYEQYHNVFYPLNVITSAVKLAERYITDRCLPDSAIDVIDLCGAQTVLTSREPLEINHSRVRLKEIEKQKVDALSQCNFAELDTLCEEENRHKLTLANFNRKYEKDKSSYQITITEDDVASVISDICNIPTNKLNTDEKKKVAHIDNILKQSIIGQDEAIQSVCKAIKRNKVGLNNPNRPLLTALLCGPTGTGKSLLAKKLAEEIYGDEKALIRIDMSEYSEKNSVTKLTGSAPGYVGYDQGGHLTEAVKNKQYCVLLLDEIEKADESVYNVFLQLFDEGRLTDSSGTLVNFKNAIVLMTSNVGAKKANELKGGVGFVTDEDANKKSIIDKELRKKFTPEFLNRIDKIVQFNSLSDEVLYDIVKLECNKFAKRIEELSYNIHFDDSVYEYIHSLTLKEKEYGARPIIRLIQDNIEDKITELLLENEYDKGYTFNAKYNDEKIEII